MSTRARALVSALVATLVVAGYAGWIAMSAWQASKVSLSAAELLDCEDRHSIVSRAKLAEREGDLTDDPEGRTGPTTYVRLDRRLDCVLRTQVVSTASAAVTVERLTWAGLGPTSGAGATAEWPHEGGPTLSEFSEADALFDLTGRHGLLDPQEDRTQYAVRVTYHRGCLSPDASTWIPDSPTATIRVLGRTHTIRAAGPGVGFQGTDESDCGDVPGDD